MEKIVPTNKHSRRHSTGNLAFEYTDVLSRYLKEPPSSSCHENCKQLDSTITTPERSNKTPPTSKRIFTPIPKRSSTKDVKINNTSLVKNQLKPLPNEPIKRDFLKSKSKSNDPFYIPPSRTHHRRRYSEIILPTGGLGDVLDAPPVPSLTKPKSAKKIDSKIESRKDSKPNSLKTSANVNIPKKVQTLKTPSSSPKPVVDHGSRKSKPVKSVGETVPNQSDKTRSPTSNERVIENGCNESQISSTSKKDESLNNGCDESQGSSTSKHDETLQSHDRDNGCNEAPMSIPKKDETLRSHDQSNGGGKKPETSRRIGKSVKENGYNLPQKIKLKQGKIVDAMPCGCNTPRKHKFRQQEVSDEKDQIEDDNKVSLRRQESIKSINVEKHKRQHSGLNNVIEETASKLIQTRKSRVKALVGAFEMISESKL